MTNVQKYKMCLFNCTGILEVMCKFSSSEHYLIILLIDKV